MFVPGLLSQDSEEISDIPGRLRALCKGQAIRLCILDQPVEVWQNESLAIARGQAEREREKKRRLLGNCMAVVTGLQGSCACQMEGRHIPGNDNADLRYLSRLSE